jgi:RNA polymerase sigma-70 factor (ECF subfamily)
MELAVDLHVAAEHRQEIRAPLSECSDGELLQRIGAGDRDAFDVLYRRFVRPVFALALRRLGDRGRAEDATQETFASVWRSA